MLRKWIVCVVVALCLMWPLWSSHADQASNRISPLLIDLDGWQAGNPEVMSVGLTDPSISRASRSYLRSPARARASIMIGVAAGGALRPLQSGVNLQTSTGHMITSSMHGMTVLKNFNMSDKSGAVMVALGKEAIFIFSYTGIDEDEAVALAEKFDWGAMQAAVQAR